jgi:hypothetical protein
MSTLTWVTKIRQAACSDIRSVAGPPAITVMHRSVSDARAGIIETGCPRLLTVP